MEATCNANCIGLVKLPEPQMATVMNHTFRKGDNDTPQNVHVSVHIQIVSIPVMQ